MIYAVLHSGSYRARFQEKLEQDYARIPIPATRSLALSLKGFGADLIAIHLFRDDFDLASWNREQAQGSRPNALRVGVVGSGRMEVEKVSYSDETVWIDKARTRGFRGVPEEVWNFHIGGYQVCQKWLKHRQAKGGKNPRPGRVLTDEEINHYQTIVVALNETIRIMKEIDEVIDQHGGWPDAFIINPDGDGV